MLGVHPEEWMRPTRQRSASPDPAASGQALFTGGAFVGRSSEMVSLVAALDDALAGRGGLFLVAGEPGIGKSRLADELMAVARDRGARVLWGRCWEAGGAPAYWPWVQSLRSCIRDTEPEVLREEMSSGASDIAQVVSELRELFPRLPDPPTVDPETARFRLFDAVAAFLRRAGRRRPLVMILDDLHAADEPSLFLLRFLANQLDDASILVVALYRDTELVPDHPLTEAVVELDRLSATRRLPLAGISKRHVAELIERSTGHVPAPAVMEAIHAHTDGNPLFVAEVVRLLAVEGRLDAKAGPEPFEIAVPTGVHQVILRRLGRLSRKCVEVLTMASVLGREFDLIELERVTELTADQLLDVLEEAAAARVVTDVPGVLGRLRFSHALVRDALYEMLPVARRVRLHGEIGSSLVDLYGADPEGHLAELAHHFVLAAPGGEVDRAVGYAEQAGRRAIRLLAYEEAARLFHLALRALDLKRPIDRSVRCDLLLALGDAETRAGREAEAKRAFLQAADQADALRAADQLARAALGYGGRFVWARAGRDRRVTDLLRRALAALPEEDGPLRARVMARLAGVLRDERNREPRAALSEQALAMARRLGDEATLADALDGRYAVLLWPENPEERIAVADELQRVAESIGDMEKAIQARCYRSIALLELGDVPAVKAELGIADALAEELGQRAQVWLVTAMRATVALFQGRFDEGRDLMGRALSHGEGAQRSDAILSHRIHTFTLRRFRGGLEELEATLRRSIDEYPARPMFRCMLALLYADAGRSPEAGAILRELAEDGFSALPRSNEWLFSMSMLAEVTAALGEAELAGGMNEALIPYSTRNGATADYISTGSVARYLGILAAVRGKWEEAGRWLEEGLEANRRMGALPFVAHTLHDQGRLYLARDEFGDPERAAGALSAALETGRALGMDPLVRKVESLLNGLEGAAAPARSASAAPESPPRPNLFRREGEYWTIAFEGKAFRIRDLKGLRYLARLLGEPAREFHVLDLVAAVGPGVNVSHRGEPGMGVAASEDAGPLLDPTAKAEYRRRLHELEEAIEDAEGLGDLDRAGGLKREREFLVAELARAVGLGGRDRRAASLAERARVSVTRAIRTALARIREHNQTLGDHLDRTIRTGVFCSYEPDPRLPANWLT